MTKKEFITKPISWIKALRRNKIIGALFLLVQGLFFVMKPGTDMTGFARIVGILVIVAAAVSIISYFADKDKSSLSTWTVVLCFLLIGMSIVGLMYLDSFGKALRYIMGAVVIFSGASNILGAVRLEEKKGAQLAVSLAAGVIQLGFGVGLIAAPIEVSTIMKRYMGIVLVLNALIDLWFIYRMSAVIKQH